VLDTGALWPVQDFQLEVVEDILAGEPEVWMVLPEGNAKTTLLGGVALYHADYTPSAEVVLGASSRDQCEWLHRQAAGFVERTPGLNKRFRVYDGYRRIKALRTGGRIQVFAADERTGDGVIFTLALLDELHRHRDLRLYRTWRGKTRKRGGQVAAISTAGEPDSEFEQIRARVRQEAADIRRNGAHTRAAGAGMVLHDYSVPADGDVEDMEQVKAANPLSTITAETLAEDFGSPTMSRTHWRRMKCNQAVRGIETAIDEAEWDRAGENYPGIPAGEHIWVGYDAGWKWDCTAFVPYLWRSREERVLGVPTILTPPRDGTSLDTKVVKQAFRDIYERNPVDVVVMDESRAEDIAAWLKDEFPEMRVVPYGQGDSMKALAAERFLEALREDWLRQPRDAEFTRHVMNAIARLLKDGRTRFDRKSSSRNKSQQDERVWDALDAATMVNASAAGEFLAIDEPAPTHFLDYEMEFL
jgi:phage terminase large subunit-like protein